MAESNVLANEYDSLMDSEPSLLVCVATKEIEYRFYLCIMRKNVYKLGFTCTEFSEMLLSILLYMNFELIATDAASCLLLKHFCKVPLC